MFEILMHQNFKKTLLFNPIIVIYVEKNILDLFQYHSFQIFWIYVYYFVNNLKYTTNSHNSYLGKTYYIWKRGR